MADVLASIVATRSWRPVVGQGIDAGGSGPRNTRRRPSMLESYRNNPWKSEGTVGGG